MSEEEISDQLEQLYLVAKDFAGESYALVDRWSAYGNDPKAVVEILQFMEKRPDLHFGSPGALVHFVERISGYEVRLVDSLKRKPTAHTLWMLNRVVNGCADVAQRMQFINLMKCARDHEHLDSLTIERVDSYLSRFAELGWLPR